MAKFEDYNVRINNGIEECFYPELGWITRERFSMPDVQEFEHDLELAHPYECNAIDDDEYLDDEDDDEEEFDSDPNNIMKCDECPHIGTGDCNTENPCGFYKCIVQVSIDSDEDDYE